MLDVVGDSSTRRDCLMAFSRGESIPRIEDYFLIVGDESDFPAAMNHLAEIRE